MPLPFIIVMMLPYPLLREIGLFSRRKREANRVHEANQSVNPVNNRHHIAAPCSRIRPTHARHGGLEVTLHPPIECLVERVQCTAFSLCFPRSLPSRSLCTYVSVRYA